MASANAETGPYAPPTNILQLIHRQREAGLPDVITSQLLIRLGMPEGNLPRIMQAMKFLAFIDEEGRQTDLFQRLRKATTEDYPAFLEQVLKSAYAPIFAIRNPATATDIELSDAFRNYEPSGQRPRMVTLFLGLCREAQITADGPVVRTRARIKTRKVSQDNANNKNKEGIAPKPADEVKNIDTSSHKDKDVELNSHYQLLQVLISQLPANATWTEKRRDQWLGAMTASIDLLIEIKDTVEQKEPQQKLSL